MNLYCKSRYQAQRRTSCEVKVGDVCIGGNHPVRVQSMTTTQTLDVDATTKQAIELAEAGCEIVRITAPNAQSAKALGAIRKKLKEAKIYVPLVADIHFLPSAAMEAVEHVEKVRVNPGNYADKKRFKTRDYSEQEYQEEIDRLHEAFSPLVLRAKELGKALRIGTNHGSLSDRIMNRYGDTPLGMVESALEFIRIAESHQYKAIVLSMKASNPKVMIAAYRLAVAKMAEENMHYPLHLGVTEAGDGEDARIKSAIGIGSLLYDGLGDTIRVSLTEDPIHEIPVAKALADKATAAWKDSVSDEGCDSVDPYSFTRRLTQEVHLNDSCASGAAHPPRVFVPSSAKIADADSLSETIETVHTSLKEAKIEGLILGIEKTDDLSQIKSLHAKLQEQIQCVLYSVASQIDHKDLLETLSDVPKNAHILKFFDKAEELLNWAHACQQSQRLLVVDADIDTLEAAAAGLTQIPSKYLVFTLSKTSSQNHSVGAYRQLAETLRKHEILSPIWIRCTHENRSTQSNAFSDRLLEHSILAGALLCDGIGDWISVETEDSLQGATGLAYNILQGAKARVTRTEYVACPSCGRTLFDLQSTTQKIRARTGHLKGVTIAIMGCIVNGPGEMADADFGYVGGAPGKVNLYVGKECVKKSIPESEAVDRLINLIQEHGKWHEPLCKI